MTKLTNIKKIKIAVSVVAAVALIFSVIMFGIWAGVEVYCKKVSYETLQKKFGDYFIVPSGLEDDISEPCRVYFPKADPDSNHRYGKYTNLTVRNNYATHYTININRNDINGYVSASKEVVDLSLLLSDGYEVTQIDGVDVYYLLRSEKQLFDYYLKMRFDLDISFVLDGVHYNISTATQVEGNSVDGDFEDESLAEDSRKRLNEYTQDLFSKIFIADSNSHK
ncbi:MAG: hypothetical protein K2O35_01560 [Clostridia bacterium]|nr:hypothetical protein [Clostridia bacterium]